MRGTSTKPSSWRTTSPTVEEIAHQLAGAVVFVKADALKAFLQVHLIEESSKLLVINTHKGRYRFKRMPFRAKMSQDVFQMKMDLIMERCPGVISIHNDIVVYGVSDEDHYTKLINLLNVAQVEGLVLNSKKLELKCPRVSFFGVEYSADGMHPCPKKIQGITEMTPSHRQATAGQFHRNGHIHGELHATSVPSHQASQGNAETGGGVRLG